MNLRMYSIALLISAFPHFALAGSGISLTKEDFIAAERLTPDGETILRVKLSKSGKAKFKRLNQDSVNKDVHAEIAGVTSH
jgi:hypothetical protein